MPQWTRAVLEREAVVAAAVTAAVEEALAEAGGGEVAPPLAYLPSPAEEEWEDTTILPLKNTTPPLAYLPSPTVE